MIFEKFSTFKIERPDKYGGSLEFSSYKELETAFANGELHPMDLKTSVINYIDLILTPVREYFEKNKEAKHLKELVEKYEITR